MRILGPVAEPAAHLAAVKIAKLAHRCRVGFQPIGDDGFRPAVAFEPLLQKRPSRRFIAFFGDVTLEVLALVISRPLEVVPLAVDLHEHLVKVPAPVPKTTQPRHLLRPDVLTTDNAVTQYRRLRCVCFLLLHRW